MAFIYPDTYGVTGTRGIDTPRWVGTMFRPVVNVQSSGGRVYKPVWGSGATGHPDRARLYNFDSGTLIEELDISGAPWPADASAGWVSYAWATVHELVAGVRYIVAYRIGSGMGFAFESGAPSMPTGADANLLQAIGPVGNVAAYSGLTPSQTANATTDFTWNSTSRNGSDVWASLPTGISATDLSNALASWFSTSDNTHHGDVPWATKAELDTVASEVADVQSKANGTTGFDALKASIAALQTDVTTLLSRLGTPPTTITGQIAGVITSLAGDITTMGTSVSHDIAGVENHLIDAVLGQAAFPSGSPNLTWTMTAETDFDTQLAWTVAADLYVVNITATRPGIGTDSFAGLPWYHRLGTWCPLNGSLGTSRRFVEFASQALEDGGRRMPGLAIRCQPGTIGTVQAWNLA